MIHDFHHLLEYAKKVAPKKVLVIYPSNEETFGAIRDALDALAVKFVLVGEEKIIRGGFNESQLNRMKIVHCPGIPESLKTSIKLVRDGEVDILMKGGVDTSTMMKAVLREESGLRVGRLLTDIFVLEFSRNNEHRFVMITDGGMTLAPDLPNKVELIRNAVEVAHALGNENPKVAVLSATEFVLPNLPSTLDAAALSKMNERGQIKGCIVDGPFALDNAISPEAAAEKGIKSPVAGHADILLAANIESANSLAKSTTYFANLPLAHVIVGGKVPVLIPSRADKKDAKLLSIALGVIMSEWGTKNPSLV